MFMNGLVALVLRPSVIASLVPCFLMLHAKKREVGVAVIASVSDQLILLSVELLPIQNHLHSHT